MANGGGGFAPGTLVHARGREWVVLPESSEPMLVLKPLGGTEDEVAGIHTGLEHVTSADFPAPTLAQIGDHRSTRLLRDALRLGFRSSAGPFRSFGRIGFEPRPYQLVPLLLALKRDPVRILIADDVGIGKTIEAGLIARELLDRGDAKRLAVLCPPHLAEQWQRELAEKFHIDAELLLPSTVASLERRLGGPTDSVFDNFDRLIISLDYIKSDKRRDEFRRHCPDLVIVDEAHVCAHGDAKNKGRHQRHELLASIASDATRHLILVTATPHSGKDEEFRSLLALLDPALANLPENLSGPTNEKHREFLAKYLVQRRRGDIAHYLAQETPFPTRDAESGEVPYALDAEYRTFFDRLVEYAREVVSVDAGDRRAQRIRYWSMLALLRSVVSSPQAAASTLRERSRTVDAADAEAADAIGRESVFDTDPTDEGGAVDLPPGAEPELDEGTASLERKRLQEFAIEAERLANPDRDAKLRKVIAEVKKLLAAGFCPIVFCRYIPTAEYVAEHLRRGLASKIKVEAVTGMLPPTEREDRIAELARHEKRVLVATDCLSEGINLQHAFDAVVHYDLSWNPTRHEQRDGRVDRYGQQSPTVRILTVFGKDNRIDGAVLEVLLKKHNAIRQSLGVSVPVPADVTAVSEAILSSLLLKEKPATPGRKQGVLFDNDERDRIHLEWDRLAEREKRSRTHFAQASIHPDAVAKELEAASAAVGSGVDVARFVHEALTTHGALVELDGPSPESGVLRTRIGREVPRALRESLAVCGLVEDKERRLAFEPRPGANILLTRTHPLVESLATYVLERALDDDGESDPRPIARRCGVVRTKAVAKRTTLVLARFRFDVVTERKDGDVALLAEESAVLAFRGSPSEPEWLTSEVANELLAAQPSGNVSPEQAKKFVGDVLAAGVSLRSALDAEAHRRAASLLEEHRRIRDAARGKGSFRVEAKVPADLVGFTILLPDVAL